jgi:hypothetical protein
MLALEDGLCAQVTGKTKAGTGASEDETLYIYIQTTVGATALLDDCSEASIRCHIGGSPGLPRVASEASIRYHLRGSLRLLMLMDIYIYILHWIKTCSAQHPS